MFQEIDNAMRNIKNNQKKMFRDMMIVTLISVASVLGALYALEGQLKRVNVIDQETIAQHNMERSQ